MKNQQFKKNVLPVLIQLAKEKLPALLAKLKTKIQDKRKKRKARKEKSSS